MKTFTKNDLGCVIDCSARSADDLNVRTIRTAQRLGMTLGNELEDVLQRHVDGQMTDDDSQTLSEASDDALDFLNSQNLPSYCSFYFEDNSLFLSPSLENAREDVGFVSSKEAEYPEPGYKGEWLHVNDHGNATLYFRGDDGKDVEIWSIV